MTRGSATVVFKRKCKTPTSPVRCHSFISTKKPMNASIGESSTTSHEPEELQCRLQPVCESSADLEEKVTQEVREEVYTVESAPVSSANSRSDCPAAHKVFSDSDITHFGYRNRRKRRKVNRHKFLSHYRPRKIVVVGDMHSGKSCLVSSYCIDQFQDTYTPTLMRCLSTDTRVQGKLIDIMVVDTPGRYDYLPFRQVAYSRSDLVMVCFALDCPQSLQHVEEFWVPEILEHAPGIPYMLVGNRRDLRDELYANWCCCQVCQECYLGCEKGKNTLKRIEADEFLNSSLLTTAQGIAIAKRVKAVGYSECSAKFRDNTRQVFEHATELAITRHRRRRKHKMRGPEACIIL